MANFVTLAAAKFHLRIDGEDQNADLYAKVQQASAIVADYLKVRLIAIASVSAANPAVVTTSVVHSLTSGGTYTLANTDTTPTVNGAQVVTVTSPTTFTIPVNVTSGQSTELGTVGAATWTETTTPFHVQAATLLVLTHLFEKRGDDMTTDEALWDAIGRILVRSRDPALA